MSKPESQSTTSITAEDLRAYIESQDDFAFEREVFHKAKGLGLAADHAGLYEDPVTNKLRQFDIRASKTVDDLQIRLAIECKGLSKTYPLLVSCVPRSRTEGLSRGAIHVQRGRRRRQFYAGIASARLGIPVSRGRPGGEVDAADPSRQQGRTHGWGRGLRQMDAGTCVGR